MAKTKFVFKRSECKSYKDFYERLCSVLGMEHLDDLKEFENLNYSADLLNEYLWYHHRDGLHFVFIGFDLEKIKTRRPYENYMWELIFEVVNDWVKEYPNNTVEYIAEE